VLGGQEPGYYIDKYNHEGDVIVVSRSGVNAGYVSFWKEPIFVSDGFYIESAENNLRFLYSFLKLKQNEINEMKRGAGVPHITTGHLENISIPIPSLSRQQSIVATLDKFETLISKLKEERELRQKQYEYYREKLLTF
jgi:type I restriction enzyme S subunit